LVNGVRNGTGSRSDPFVIRDWSFDGSQYPVAHRMIWIERTDRYVVIENVKIVNLTGAGQWEGIQIGEFPDIVTTQHVTIRHVAIESVHAYGIAVREGSSDVRVEANDIRLEAGADWTYGAVAMRGTHNVTFYGNHVDAYTNGSYRTVGIHLSDFFVSQERDASGLVAERNTVVNATAGGIVSESSVDTVIRRNLVYMDYPGPKSVGPNYPRGILTEKGSNDTVVAENLVQDIHWGIQVGSRGDRVYSNTIHDVDTAIYVLDNNSWNGTVSPFGIAIYDTDYWNVSQSAIRLPLNFSGTVVDLGNRDGIRTTDFTAARLITDATPSRIAYAWSGFRLNLSVTLGGDVVFDSVDTMENQTLQAAWSGSIARFNLTSFLPSNVSFTLQSGTEVLFEGSGFLASTAYALTRSNEAGTTNLGVAASTSTGILRFTIPTAIPATYALRTDTAPPVTVYSPRGIGGTNGWYTSAVEVALRASDDVSGVQAIHFRVDGGPWTVYSAPVTVGGDGPHTFEYYSTDEVGNTEVTHSQSIRVDATAPVLGNLTPSGVRTSSTLTVSWTGSDATSGIAEYRIGVDGAPSVSTGTRTLVTLSLPDGDHVIEVTATDAAGNRVDSQIRIRVDTNVFSLSGPYSGFPSIVLLIAIGVGAGAFTVWRRRERRSRSQPPSEPTDPRRP
jgi:hypothetical protein